MSTTPPEPSSFPRVDIPVLDVAEPVPTGADDLAGTSTSGADRQQATIVLDWDRERYAGAVPRRVPLPTDDAGPAWVAFPHQRYVLCARHAHGRIDTVYVTSLIGKRDSLIPAGAMERIVLDDRSVTVVVDGRPYLYGVEAGTTFDLTNRRLVGGPAHP